MRQFICDQMYGHHSTSVEKPVHSWGLNPGPLRQHLLATARPRVKNAIKSRYGLKTQFFCFKWFCFQRSFFRVTNALAHKHYLIWLHLLYIQIIYYST